MNQLIIDLRSAIWCSERAENEVVDVTDEEVVPAERVG